MSRFWEAVEYIDQKRDLRLTPEICARSGRPVLPLRGIARAEVDALVNRLYLSAGSVAPQICLFTALEAGTSSGWVCAHTSDLLASRVSASVCLVDANLAARSVHQRFGNQSQKGLTDLASDAQMEFSKVVARVPGGDLWLLTRGSAVSDWEALVGSQRMGDRISELRDHFGFILLDAPPIGICPETLALAQLVDGVVLVLRAHSTRRESALRVKEQIEANNVNVVGAVLYGAAASQFPK